MSSRRCARRSDRPDAAREMVRDPFADDQGPELQDVLDALEDPTCRDFIRQLDAPMTANELSERCDVPLSTTYRKLDLLSEASLVGEMTEIRTDGQHTTRYEADFTEVRVSLDDERRFEVGIDRPARKPDERLADLWAEVRRET